MSCILILHALTVPCGVHAGHVLATPHWPAHPRRAVLQGYSTSGERHMQGTSGPVDWSAAGSCRVSSCRVFAHAPASRFMSVVFPAPLGPTMATRLPMSMPMLRSARAEVVAPWVLEAGVQQLQQAGGGQLAGLGELEVHAVVAPAAWGAHAQGGVRLQRSASCSCSNCAGRMRRAELRGDPVPQSSSQARWAY